MVKITASILLIKNKNETFSKLLNTITDFLRIFFFFLFRQFIGQPHSAEEHVVPFAGPFSISAISELVVSYCYERIIAK